MTFPYSSGLICARIFLSDACNLIDHLRSGNVYETEVTSINFHEVGIDSYALHRSWPIPCTIRSSRTSFLFAWPDAQY